MQDILDVSDKLTIGEKDPFSVDFIGRGNIWINNTYDVSVVKLAQHIIFDAITNTAPGQLSIVGYDSDLSGVFAPFAALSAGESRLLELILDKKEFVEYLSYIKQQIQLVQNVIQGRSTSLLDFRESIHRPVEGYRLVVLSLDMGMLDNDVRANLALLMRVGPAYGISFLIISTTYMSVQTSNGKDIELSVNAIAPNITVLEVNGEMVTSPEGQKVLCTSYSAEKIVRGCEQFIDEVRNAQLPTVSFEELHQSCEMWGRKSIDGLTFSIGKYGINDMLITIGDEANQRHNVIITGAVGQGKSNLISVIIHSLCYHYSPDELQLYLLDFKEGVTFKAFSDIGQEEYLPHARTLGLESDVSFGMAVLKSLFAEYEKRMALMKERNARSLKELRTIDSRYIMPRIVVIIDEFQMMFGDDLQTGQRIGDLLERSVRLFRAAGIHFMLASQTIGGNMSLMQKKDSIFSQVPVRIALKNSVSESQQTLGVNNPAAAFLRPREAVVNLDYGEASQNRKVVIAYADENKLRPIRRIWWERLKTKPPYVFESEKKIFIGKAKGKLDEMAKSNNYAVAFLGEQISIDDDHIEVPFRNEPGRNIAIIGTPDKDCNHAVGMIESIAISLASYYRGRDSKYIFCDFDQHENKTFEDRYNCFMMRMKSLEADCSVIMPDCFEAKVQELIERKEADKPTYVFGISLDKWKHSEDPYGQGTALKKLVEQGPSNGIHFIGWWIKASSYTSQISGFGNSDAFNTKVFLRIDERTVQSMTSPFVRWAAQNNRALISDSVELPNEIVFIPYAPIEYEG